LCRIGAAVTKKLWSCALAVGLLAAACGSRAPGAQPVKSSFVPQTVDFLDDVGRGASIALDADGNPHITYIGLIEKLAPGEIPPARPVTAPALPAVLVANEKDGLWTRGFVVQTDISAPNLPKIPLTASSSTALAIDGAGVSHTVWTETRGLFYSTAPKDSQDFADPTAITQGYASQPSIVADGSGVPWVAYYAASPDVHGRLDLDVARPEGKKWTSQRIGSVTDCPEGATCPQPRTAMALLGGDPVIAYTDPASKSVKLALFAKSTGAWTTQTAVAGDVGYGLSIAAGKNGLRIAYVNGSGNVQVTSPPGRDRRATPRITVGTIQASNPDDLDGGTAIGIDQGGGEFVSWADPGAGGLRLTSSADGTTFSAIRTPGTDNGELPSMQVSKDGKVYLAWYDSVNQDLNMGTYPEELGPIAVPQPSTTGSAAPPPTGGGGTCPKSDVTIVADPGAATQGFKTTQVSAPTNKAFKLCFDNADTTIHNVFLFKTQADAANPASALAQTPSFQGPAIEEASVDALAAGSYFFHCTLHPQFMTGTLAVG